MGQNLSMGRSWVVAAGLFMVGCGIGAGSHETFALSPCSRDLGGVELAGFEVHVVATRSGEHRYPCQPTFGFREACTSARITSVLAVEGAPEAYAYDPGWTGQHVLTIAENEATSEERVEARAREKLEELRLASCSDATHAAWRVEWDADARDLPPWTLLTVVSGAIVGHVEPQPEGATCAEALRAAQSFDARIAADLASGALRAFDFVAHRESAFHLAIDLSLDHELGRDPNRVPTPQPAQDLLDALGPALARDAVLRQHLVERLLSTTRFPAGPREGFALPDWTRRLVRALPSSAEKLALFEGLAERCAAQGPVGECPADRWSALFEASFTLSDANRCTRAYGVARHLLSAPPAEVEARGLSAFHALAGCEDASTLAFEVLGARGRFPTRDEDFVYPLCLSAIDMGSALERCVSLPTYALLVSPPRCDEPMLALARAASQDTTRPWQQASVAALHRCGQDPEARALLRHFATLPTWQAESLTDSLTRTLRERP